MFALVAVAQMDIGMMLLAMVSRQCMFARRHLTRSEMIRINFILVAFDNSSDSLISHNGAVSSYGRNKTSSFFCAFMFVFLNVFPSSTQLWGFPLPLKKAFLLCHKCPV